MIPAAFDYHVPSTVGEATALLARLGEDAKVLSGGQSLIPLKQVRVAVKLTNPLDEALVRQGMLTLEEVRTSERDALVDTDAVRMVIPPQVATRLGLGVRGSGWPSTPMDARRPSAGQSLSSSRSTGETLLEEALVLDDEVLIGQTVLEKLDLFMDSRRRRLVPNPAHPDQPVTKVKFTATRPAQRVTALLG